jgi:hypothetical protein
MADDPKTTSPAVMKLLSYVDEANEIAKDCFARGANDLGVDALAVAAHYIQAARAFQEMHDAGR